ncbi:MAG TPA: hypothetical protein VEB63_01435 [Chitinophagaceae bacterium]|nr:hypothetical protein [Chitinophagaceae bacterium]
MRVCRIQIIYLLATVLVAAISGCRKADPPPAPGGTPLQVVTASRPLMDFPNGIYRGRRGGLYEGSNQRPAAHNSAGVAIAQSIRPLNAAGAADDNNGAIVWLSIGMSNTTMETQAFLPLAQNLSNRHPRLVLVDGAAGGQDINAINNPSAPYWNTVTTRLTNAGLSPQQVQIIWFKEAEAGPRDTAFATYPDALKIKFRSVMQILKNRFPNLKLVYLSDRIYAGYATTGLNPEPYSWYTGWAVKRLIADQIAGDPALTYSGTGPATAWLSWGPSLWAKGDSARSDGLVWLPGDFQSDGTHPSLNGRQKVAQLLLQFFTTDETARPWFLRP